MVKASETSITNAVMMAVKDTDLTVSESDVDYAEISYDQFTPNEIDKPTEETVDQYEFYELTVYAEEGTVTGFGSRHKTATYGQPVTVELHEDSVSA